MIRNALLLMISSLLALLVLEVLVRVAMPQDLSGTWRVYSDDGLYLLNKSHGQAKHERGDLRLNYSFANPHLRVGDTPANSNEPGVIAANRALVLGDSFTFGWLLPYENTYTAILEKNLSAEADGFEFLNAAAGGLGRC